MLRICGDRVRQQRIVYRRLSHKAPDGFDKGGTCQYITTPRVNIPFLTLLSKNKDFLKLFVLNKEQEIKQELQKWKTTDNRTLLVDFINNEKQFGLLATRNLAKGVNIGPYLGDYITEKEAINRQTRYGVKLELPQKPGHPRLPPFVIDAAHYGTEMRYMNHDSKNPNTELQLIYINWNGPFPLCIARTIRHVRKGEELTINYWL